LTTVETVQGRDKENLKIVEIVQDPKLGEKGNNLVPITKPTRKHIFPVSQCIKIQTLCPKTVGF
jgi:hypothetical protein